VAEYRNHKKISWPYNVTHTNFTCKLFHINKTVINVYMQFLKCLRNPLFTVVYSIGTCPPGVLKLLTYGPYSDTMHQAHPRRRVAVVLHIATPPSRPVKRPSNFIKDK